MHMYVHICTVVCPPVRPGQIRICVERCSHDSDCNGDEKCCSNGCGHVCTTPVPLDCSVSNLLYALSNNFDLSESWIIYTTVISLYIIFSECMLLYTPSLSICLLQL